MHTQNDYEKMCIQESDCVKENRMQPEEEECVSFECDSVLNQTLDIRKQRDQRLQKPCTSTEFHKDSIESVAVTQGAQRGLNQLATSSQHREIPNLVNGCLCSQCGNSFDQSTNAFHQLLITGEEKNMFTDCEKYSCCSTNLKNDLGRSLALSPFICSECGKCFTTARTLRRHQLIHTGERPFPCKLCGKSFRRSEVLVAHQRLHTGEKPYACTYCGKTFRQTAHLIRHQRMHKGTM